MGMCASYNFDLYNIGLDVDGVLADFNKSWQKINPHIPLSSTANKFDDVYNQLDLMEENGELDDFYLNLKPLINPNSLSFEPCCYITSRRVDSEITRQWLIKNGFPDKPVYTVHGGSKVDVAKKANVDIFIDDDYNNFLDLNKNGILTYLYTTSYNKHYNISPLMRIDKLNDIVLYI